MPLVDELHRIAVAAGTPLARLSTGRDRYGVVDAILFARAGHISVRTDSDGGYDVAVWDDGLAAWGRTTSEHDIVETMLRWQDGSRAGDLRESGSGYLAVADEANAGEAVEALWQLLLRYGDGHLGEIASAAAGNTTLRRLRPWVGHGSLHLLHGTDPFGPERRGLAFYRAGDSAFKVDVYGGQLSPRIDGAEAAVSFAARAADAW